jgi:hypothetical protein
LKNILPSKTLKLLCQIKEAQVFQKSRSHSIILDARSKFRLTNVRRQRTKVSSLGDLVPMLFVPLRQIKENSRNNCDFFKWNNFYDGDRWDYLPQTLKKTDTPLVLCG